MYKTLYWRTKFHLISEQESQNLIFYEEGAFISKTVSNAGREIRYKMRWSWEKMGTESTQLSIKFKESFLKSSSQKISNLKSKQELNCSSQVVVLDLKVDFSFCFWSIPSQSNSPGGVVLKDSLFRRADISLFRLPALSVSPFIRLIETPCIYRLGSCIQYPSAFQRQLNPLAH